MTQSPQLMCLCNVTFLFLFLSPISGANHKTVITDSLWADFSKGGGLL